MPIYEYQCAKCKKTFEYMQSFSEAPKKKCETCGGKLAKLMSASGFILKGGGWYKDLYASTRPGDSSKGSDDGGDAPKAEAKGDKAEAKADKAEAKADKADKPEKSSRSSDKPDKKSSKKKASA